PEAEISANEETGSASAEIKETEISNPTEPELVKEPKKLKPKGKTLPAQSETPAPEDVSSPVPGDRIEAMDPAIDAELQADEPKVAGQAENEKSEDSLLQQAKAELEQIADNDPHASDSGFEVESHTAEHEHEDDAHAEDDNWVEGMSRENLLQFVTDASEHCGERNMNRKVMLAKSAFNKLSKDALEQAKET